MLLAIFATARGSAAVIASCDFEPAGDTGPFSYSGGKSNAESGLGEMPVNQRTLTGNACNKTCWNLDDVTLRGASTHGNDRWWDGDGEGAVSGGTGIWSNTSAPVWASNSSGDCHVGWQSGNDDNAIFTQAGGTVSIAEATIVAARSLAFTANDYILDAVGNNVASGLILTDGGSGGGGPNTIDVVGSDHTATIAVTIFANSGVGLTKTGEGTLILSGVNTYQGKTAINAGVLSVSAPWNLGIGSPILFDGGTLRLTKAVDLRGNQPCEFLAGGGTIDTGGKTLTAETTGWSGTGSLVKAGAGVLRLGGTGSGFTGAVILKAGTLRLDSNRTLVDCPLIDVAAGATLDVSGVQGGYYGLGGAATQKLTGSGTILGNLQITDKGVHSVGDSSGVQQLQGSYAMHGLLEIEICGDSPGNGVVGYDQVRLIGTSLDNVSLDGDLSLIWSGLGWSSPSDRLWILRNDTSGTLTGEFHEYANGAVVGDYDGRSWQIWYGVDADLSAGQLVPGNDVVLAAVMPIPEPGPFILMGWAILVLLCAHRRWLGRLWRTAKP